MPSPSTSLPPWATLLVALVLAYRVVLATLQEALQGLPSLQRRRLLEEEAIHDPRLEAHLEHPQALTFGVRLLGQLLLAVLLVLLWPLGQALPGGTWTLLGLTALYIWFLDLILPAILTAGDPAGWVFRLFRFYAPVHWLMAPFAGPLALLLGRLRAKQDRVREADEEEAGEDAVTALLEEGEAEGILEEDDRELIRNVVGFGDTVVREVMTPRTSFQGIEADASPAEVWSAFRSGRHSRLPVFEGSVDQVVGILLLKDILQLDPDGPLDLRRIAKAPLFVPESKPIQDLLRDMQRSRLQMAIVVDEFGSVSGLVTLEDLLEEVFGEIEEEHEAPSSWEELPDGALRVPGNLHVEDLEARLGQAWVREGFDTVAGLVMSRLGRVPQVGDALTVPGARIAVLAMDGARVLEVRVQPDGPTLPEAGEGPR